MKTYMMSKWPQHPSGEAHLELLVLLLLVPQNWAVPSSVLNLAMVLMLHVP